MNVKLLVCAIAMNCLVWAKTSAQSVEQAGPDGPPRGSRTAPDYEKLRVVSPRNFQEEDIIVPKSDWRELKGRLETMRKIYALEQRRIALGDSIMILKRDIAHADFKIDSLRSLSRDLSKQRQRSKITD